MEPENDGFLKGISFSRGLIFRFHDKFQGSMRKTLGFTLPETNSKFAPENGWLEDEQSFLNGPFLWMGWSWMPWGKYKDGNYSTWNQLIEALEM